MRMSVLLSNLCYRLCNMLFSISPSALLAIVSLFLLAYIVYQRHFHPLSRFPGPYLASLTNFYRFHHELRGDLPTVLHSAHQKYGPFVRIAPNEVDTNTAECIDVVYKKGGRHYLKSDFYDGFTALRPNIFGTRDETHHSLRRRQMAHAFSHGSLVKMEYIFDRHVKALLDKLDKRAERGKSFHFEDVLRFYSQDCNGDLSLGIQFRTQEHDDPSLVPPLNDHIALAKLTGYVPWTKPSFDRFGKWLPWPYLQRLLASRAWMRGEAARVTDLEFRRTGRDKGQISPEEDEEPGRVNLFTGLVRAKDPDTGELIERDDVISNAITFLTAGSHSVSSTLEIMWWYLTHYPDIKKDIQAELDSVIGGIPGTNEDIQPFEGLETKLPITNAFFLETYRLAPTFQHPAPRMTPPPTSPRFPTIIGDTLIPPNVAISASVLSLHRNKDIWGADADEFKPIRWSRSPAKDNVGLLGHFGWGHRACIGRNQSLIMLWKGMVEVLRRFDVVVVRGEEERGKRKIELRVTGFAELAMPLEVRVRRR